MKRTGACGRRLRKTRRVSSTRLQRSLKRADYSLPVVPLSLPRGWALVTPAAAGREGPEGTDLEVADDEKEGEGENRVMVQVSSCSILSSSCKCSVVLPANLTGRPLP